jgi:pimeloyl-ACP methyl ester carboxylesterase
MPSQKVKIVYKNHPLQIDYFIRQGQGDADTVVYLHGLGCSKNDFLESVNSTELHAYTLVAFDFPGCGNSPYPNDARFDIDDLVELTHLVVMTLQLDDVIIIGHSMGGLVALLYAEKYGEHVKGFINVEGNLASEDCFFSREVAQHSFDYFSTTSFTELKRHLANSPNRGFQKYAETLETSASARAFFECCPSLVDYSEHGSLNQRYIALNIPKLFVYGSENRTLSYLSALKERGCEMTEIPESNHFPGYDNPHAFYHAIAAFLEKRDFAVQAKSKRQ